MSGQEGMFGPLGDKIGDRIRGLAGARSVAPRTRSGSLPPYLVTGVPYSSFRPRHARSPCVRCRFLSRATVGHLMRRSIQMIAPTNAATNTAAKIAAGARRGSSAVPITRKTATITPSDTKVFRLVIWSRLARSRLRRPSGSRMPRTSATPTATTTSPYASTVNSPLITGCYRHTGRATTTRMGPMSLVVQPDSGAHQRLVTAARLARLQVGADDQVLDVACARRRRRRGLPLTRA